MIAAYFDPAVSRQLKQVGLERDLSNQALIREALNDLFEKFEIKWTHPTRFCVRPNQESTPGRSEITTEGAYDRSKSALVDHLAGGVP